MSESAAIHPFKLSIPQKDLDDLQTRLRLTRWPDKEPVNDWSQGAPLSKVQDLCDYWQTSYDWRRCEQMISSLPQFITTIDNVEIYFIHIRSKVPEALPMLLIHGWPGSILEFRDVIEPLVDPQAHGGDSEDAFHLVIPAIPGYAFSSKPKEAGWGFERVGKAFSELMQRLGYAETGWVAQGGDFGADIVAALGHQSPKGLKSIHMNSIFPDVAKELQTPAKDEEGVALARRLDERWSGDEWGYFEQQRTRPQTLGYGLADSPVALAAWIYEKFHVWSDRPVNDKVVFSKDQMLDHIMLYWLSNSGTSSVRFYWENQRDQTFLPITMPVGVSWFPKDPTYGPREWAERYYENIVHWKEMDKGGHFAAWEVPHLFVSEIREWRRKLP